MRRSHPARREARNTRKRDRLRREAATERVSGDALQMSAGFSKKNKNVAANGSTFAATMELMIRFELTTSSLPMTCSTY